MKYPLILLVLLILAMSCTIEEDPVMQPEDQVIVPLASYNVEVTEPSGLSFASDYNSLWTVSDNTGQVYQIDLTGKIINTLTYTGVDPEGITYDSTTNSIWIIEELSREVVQLNLTGTELARHKILDGSDNNGLEGICINSDNNVFVLKEKLPGQFIELNPDFSIKTQITLDFADDYSGICCDTIADRFWIVSDENQKLFLWDKNSGIIREHSIPIDKAEGVAYNPLEGKIYIISDSEEKLYVFNL